MKAAPEAAPVMAPAPEPDSVVLPEPATRAMPAYVRSQPWAASSLEPHEAPTGMLVPLVIQVIDVEGPVCLEEIARRVAAAFGKKSAGRRVLTATRHALVAARHRDPRLRCENDFWFTLDQASAPPVRDRSAEGGATCKADALPLLEIRAALQVAREDNPGGSDEELVRAAARLMGFRRLGSDLHARIAEGLA